METLLQFLGVTILRKFNVEHLRQPNMASLMNSMQLIRSVHSLLKTNREVHPENLVLRPKLGVNNLIGLTVIFLEFLRRNFR
jgi:hypothetical protein